MRFENIRPKVTDPNWEMPPAMPGRPKAPGEAPGTDRPVPVSSPDSESKGPLPDIDSPEGIAFYGALALGLVVLVAMRARGGAMATA